MAEPFSLALSYVGSSMRSFTLLLLWPNSGLLPAGLLKNWKDLALCMSGVLAAMPAFPIMHYAAALSVLHAWLQDTKIVGLLSSPGPQPRALELPVSSRRKR